MVETDSGLLQHRVISVSGGMPFLPVTSADGISGGHITDAIDLLAIQVLASQLKSSISLSMMKI